MNQYGEAGNDGEFLPNRHEALHIAVADGQGANVYDDYQQVAGEFRHVDVSVKNVAHHRAARKVKQSDAERGAYLSYSKY
jgi:hypothetical protein